MNLKQAEYIWIDGHEPTATLRSKSRVVNLPEKPSVESFPEWGFDGSSTNQAAGDNSDCLLKPVNFVKDPIRGEGNYLVMCEVNDRHGNPHTTNTRALLRKTLEAGAAKHEAFFGFEQEYTMFDKEGNPLGWPENGFPEPQGPYYCGVGASRIAGRELVEEHTQACIDAGLLIYGINAEVMLGQWEFQIGYRGFEENADALTTTDHMWIALWLLERLGEEYGIDISIDNKPRTGDWNGAGCHTNFSTKEMRDKETGKAAVEQILNRLSQKHDEHINVYGADLDQRLTGDHETCAITEFRSGESDRGASIRIPVATAQKGYGYLEDRRPGANSDPYLVAARLLVTICDLDESNLNVSEEREVVFA